MENEGCMVILTLLVELVVAALCIGFVSCLVCSSMDVEWNGGIWVLSVVILFAVVGLIYWLFRDRDKK